MSKDIMLLFAEVMPEDMILDELKNKIKEYELIKTEESKKTVETYCMLFISKSAVKKHGIEKIMKDADEMTRIKNRLNDTKQS